MAIKIPVLAIVPLIRGCNTAVFEISGVAIDWEPFSACFPPRMTHITINSVNKAAKKFSIKVEISS